MRDSHALCVKITHVSLTLTPSRGRARISLSNMSDLLMISESLRLLTIPKLLNDISLRICNKHGRVDALRSAR